MCFSVMAFLRSICYRAPNLVAYNSLNTRDISLVLSRASSTSSPQQTSSSPPQPNGSVGESSVHQRSQLKGNLLIRNASTAAAASQRDPLDVGFNDPNAAFKSKTTFELIRAYLVYLMCSSETLVENNMKVSCWPFSSNMLRNKLFGENVFSIKRKGFSRKFVIPNNLPRKPF